MLGGFEGAGGAGGEQGEDDVVRLDGNVWIIAALLGGVGEQIVFATADAVALQAWQRVFQFGGAFFKVGAVEQSLSAGFFPQFAVLIE